jgi:hypothetical protein
MNTNLAAGHWARTSEAVVLLGISRNSLLRRKSEGYFKPGKHFVTTGPYKTAPCLWNIGEVRMVMGSWVPHK